MLCRQLQNRANRQSCVTQPCLSLLYSFQPSGLQISHFTTSLPVKVQLGPSSRHLPRWDGRTRVWGKGGHQTRGDRVARDATLSDACQILCPTVVLTIKVCNPTLHFFFFPLCLDCDTANNKIMYCYQTPWSVSLGWIFSPTGEI